MFWNNVGASKTVEKVSNIVDFFGSVVLRKKSQIMQLETGGAGGEFDADDSNLPDMNTWLTQNRLDKSKFKAYFKETDVTLEDLLEFDEQDIEFGAHEFICEGISILIVIR